MKIVRLAAVAGFALSLATSALAQDKTTQPAGDRDPSKGWVVDATPYLMLPSISGTLRYDTSSFSGGSLVPPVSGHVDLQVPGSGLLSNLKGAALFTVSAQRGNGMLFSDIVWVNLVGQNAVVQNVNGPLGVVNGTATLSGGMHFATTMWTVGGGYDIVRNPSFSLVGFGGFRALNVATSFSWQFAGPIGILNTSGSAQRNVTMTDPMLGVRGKLGLGGAWFVPYYADFGQGANNDTWQGFGGIGYAYRWGNLVAGYRAIHYNMNPAGLLQNVGVGGATLGATFHL